MGRCALGGFRKALGATAGRCSITCGVAVLAAVLLCVGVGAALSSPMDRSVKVGVGRDDPVQAAGTRTTGEPRNGSRVHPTLSRLLAERAEDEPIKAWVLFTDKGIGGSRALATATAALASTYNPRAVGRRRNRRTLPGLFDEHDLPVARQYIDAVKATGTRVNVTSKWLNGVSVWATRQQVERVDQLPFVKIIQPVRRGRKIEPVDVQPVAPAPRAGGPLAATGRLDYGNSAAQLAQIDLINVHEQGFTGAGVIIGILDTGFRTSHVAFTQSGHGLQVIEEWDFINNDGNTDHEEGDPTSQHHHGTWILGTLGTYMPGELIGAAYDASFILCKTEDTSQESPVEEDYYVAGLEFIEAHGGDVATSSLGYIAWYEQRDLDGMTAVTTIAVNIATANGVHCCTAAGNEGHDADPTESSLITPSDAFQVLTCGAVDLEGDIAYFSSDGPTADGRVKPELLARGFETHTIDTSSDGTLYETVNGTSLSTPLVAGAVACLVQAHPTWSVDQMRVYLFLTAGDYVANGTHDPLYIRGYGIVDAFAALAGDCNNNGLSDETDIADGTSMDCNADGLPDDCELTMGLSPDCNENGRPDECDLGTLFISASPELSPIGYGFVQTHTAFSPPPAATDVTLSFTAYADLNTGLTESIDVSINGNLVGPVFVSGASDCPTVPDTDELILSAATFNDIVDGEDAVITMEAAFWVDANLCLTPPFNQPTYITVTLRYHGAGSSPDCNLNGVPDECEPDCNENEVADECDIAAGTSPDCNFDGVPDECAPGDFNGDGFLRLSDLGGYSDCFTGPCGDPPCDPALYLDPCCAIADFDHDGDSDLADWAAFQVAFTVP